jgi:hypothetical protein
MTLKALDILVERSNADNTPFMMMSEAASIDKAMHIGSFLAFSLLRSSLTQNSSAGDYHRALGDLLELDNVVAATLKRLEEHGLKDETLVVVTAGTLSFLPAVWGNADDLFVQTTLTDSTFTAVLTPSSSVRPAFSRLTLLSPSTSSPAAPILTRVSPTVDQPTNATKRAAVGTCTFDFL